MNAAQRRKVILEQLTEADAPLSASVLADLLADCVGSQPILTQVEWGKLKVQLPSNYATLLRLVG